MEMETGTQVHPSPEYKAVFADILSQAITGEIIGMENFASLVEIFDDVDEKMEAVEHADSERAHAVAFQRAADRLGVEVIVNPRAPYWERVRSAFLHWCRKGDLAACVLIQEVMLESFAVSMYYQAAEAAVGELKDVFNRIAQEEEGHLEHSLAFLRSEMEKDYEAFEAKVLLVHDDVMTVLSEMVAKEDLHGHCGLCKGDCVKKSLAHVHLDIREMRGRALNHYLTSLDRLGLKGERTLTWVAQLPA